MSTDRRAWRWAGGEHDRFHFVCRAPADARELYLAFSFPYQLEDFERFSATYRRHPDFRVSMLTRTAKGRDAPLVTIGDPESAAGQVLFCSRHHACESVASYVLEGVMDHVLSAEAEGLRRRTAFTVVPLVDLDGVEDGDQGKSRSPHDHNRDYMDESRYPTVRAIKDVARGLAQRNFRLYIDFHCPWIRDGGNEAASFPEPPEPSVCRLREFAAILRQVNTSPIPYTGKFDVPHGTSWNVPTPGFVSSSRFMREIAPQTLLFAGTLETSYSLAEGAVVTPEAARAFGRCFGQALDRFLAAHDG